MPARKLLYAVLLSAALSAAASADEDLAQVLRRGDAEYAKGDYESARSSFEKAFQATQQEPAGAPIRYDILKRLTSVRTAAGEFPAAQEFAQQMIAWREALDPADPKLADDLLISASLYRAVRDYDRALEVLKRVEEMHVKAFGPQSVLVADDFSRIGQIHLIRKQMEDAAKWLGPAIEVRSRATGPLDPSLLPDLDRLAEASSGLADWPRAEQSYRRALLIREALYGKQHSDLIATVEGLATAYTEQGVFADAEPLWLRLLSLWETTTEKDHPMVAVTLDKLAVFYARQDKLDKMRDALARSTAIRAHFLGVGLALQAHEASLEKQVADAKDFYRRALVVLDTAGGDHQELRAQIERLLKSLDAPPGKGSADKASKALDK